MGGGDAQTLNVRRLRFLAALVLAAAVGTNAGPAAAQDIRFRFAWTHPEGAVIANGTAVGHYRVYGWSFRADFRSPLSLNYNYHAGFIEDAPGSWGLVVNTFQHGTVHYRVDFPRGQASLFAGFGRIKVSGGPDVLVANGPVIGADILFELPNRWLLTGWAIYGPGWGLTTLTGPTAATTYTDFQVGLAAPFLPNGYGQIGYREISWSGLPSTFLCSTPGCTVKWSGSFIGLVFRL